MPFLAFFFAGPSKLEVGIVDLSGTGNLVAPFPNGLAFFTDDALSFFEGPSKLDEGVLDFGGTGNFAGPLPNGVAFFTDDAPSFSASLRSGQAYEDSRPTSVLRDLDAIFGRAVESDRVESEARSRSERVLCYVLCTIHPGDTAADAV